MDLHILNQCCPRVNWMHVLDVKRQSHNYLQGGCHNLYF